MDLEMQLRAAEARRADLERQHGDALASLRGCGLDTLEARQSRARELDKKVALETVRCEELQLELATSQRGRMIVTGGSTMPLSSTSPSAAATAAAVANMSAVQNWTNKGTEIERIMAKIEQDNRILAELDHSRSTTLGTGLATSASSHALGECSPPVSPITMSHTTPSMYLTSSNQFGHNNSYQTGGGGPTTTNLANYLTSSSSSYNNPTQYNSLSTHQQQHQQQQHHNYNNIGNKSQNLIMNNLNQQQQRVGGGLLLGQSSLLTGGGGGYNTSSSSSGGGGHQSNLVTSVHMGVGGNTGITSLISNPLNTSMLPSSSNYVGIGTTTSTINNPLLATSSFTNPVTSTLNQFSSSLGGGSSSAYNNPIATTNNIVTFSNPLSSQFNSLALSGGNVGTTGGGGMSIKLKPLDEIDLGTRRVATPVTPHPPPSGWSLSGITGMSDTRARILNDALDSDWNSLQQQQQQIMSDRNYLVNNGHGQQQQLIDGQVDMLDIPGKGRCSVYIARFSYDPEPDADEELNIQAGDYLLVWGEPIGPGGYLDAELLDGRRGLVPAHFVQRLLGDDLLEFHQAVLSTLREEEINQENFAADVQRLNEMAEMSETHDDDGPDGEQVPAPRQLTLERQLNKSVLISWTTPDFGPGNHIESYHVYVDGVLKTTIKATERTRALVEGVDSNRPHRISVRSVTANRRTSRDAACTMIIGRDTHQLGPSAVRASNITSTSSVISWLPANSNHQHVVCVNNVEVRTVKPGVYRHTITGLAANTQYRVTVRAKHHRAAQNVANLAEDLPMPAAAHTDFRTLPKGLPDPPSDILVEPGPQDGTLLVTWHPILTPHHPGSTITGYAVYADGKKVTDVDSPTGDHALIDISKLLGLNPKHVTVRTKARDSQSTDSLPTPIPISVLRGGGAGNNMMNNNMKMRQQPHSTVMPAHLRQQMPRSQQQQQQMGGQQQQIIEPDENLSDKEIFPNSSIARQSSGIPAIAQRSIAEITKESYDTANLSEDELLDRRQRQYHQQRSQQQQQQQQPQQQQQHRPNQQQQQQRNIEQQQQAQQQQQYYQQAQQQNQQRLVQNMRNQQQQQQGQGMQMIGNSGGGQSSRNAPNNQQQQQMLNNPPNPQKRARWFVALFDYDPSTMSPNPDACDEELPFSEGDTIKVWGDKDADGFYWGECRGRRGFVPHNMVMEVEGNQNRDRWGDIYANMQVKRMVALYDYDPQELSPNVDAEVELSFTTGQIINVYGEMDDDGFYMGEIDGVRGLVPSNFLSETNEQYGGQTQTTSQTGIIGGQSTMIGGRGIGGQRGGRGVGPGARGPPPPPRENQMRPRTKDACPVFPSQLDNAINTATPNTQVFTEHNQTRGRGMLRAVGNQQQQQQQQQQPGMLQQAFNQAFNHQSSNTSATNNMMTQNNQTTQAQTTTTSSIAHSLFGGGGGQQQQPQQQQQPFSGNNSGQNQSRMQQQHKGVPQVIPNVSGGGGGMMGMGQQHQMSQNQQQQMLQNQQQQQQNAPNLMQKLNEITAPGGDILSKGKELIFMKFGLGGGK